MTRRPVLPGASELFRRTDTSSSVPEVTELPSLSTTTSHIVMWQDSFEVIDELIHPPALITVLLTKSAEPRMQLVIFYCRVWLTHWSEA